MGIGVFLLAFTELGKELLANQEDLHLGAFLFRFRLPFPINLFALGVITVLVYSASFASSLKAGGGFNSNIKRLAYYSSLGNTRNWLVIMPYASSSLLLSVILISQLQDVLGVPSGSPFSPSNPPPQYRLFIGLAYSPILEELTFRISILGAAVAIRALWSSKGRAPILILRKRLRLVALSFLDPDLTKRKVKLPNVADHGWGSIHWTEIWLLTITSLAFGTAHFLSQGSYWQIGKITTATVSGFALGLVFLRYGACAAILLHWFFNFYFGTLEIASDLVGGVFRVANTFIFFLAIAVGLLSLGLALRWLGSQSRHLWTDANSGSNVGMRD